MKDKEKEYNNTIDQEYSVLISNQNNNKISLRYSLNLCEKHFIVGQELPGDV